MNFRKTEARRKESIIFKGWRKEATHIKGASREKVSLS